MGIRDSRASAPPDRYGVTGRQYPTPNIFDAVLVEDVPVSKERYGSLMPGTPHPDDSTRLLVWKGPVKGNNNEMALRLIYCSTRNAQDTYNASVDYAQGNNDYPRFTRTYFLPREDYAPDTKLHPLESVIGLLLVTGGTGYTSDSNGRIALTFTGGGGTGAAGYAQVVKGAIVALLLTDGGTGYTSAPTVTFSAPHGVAATATAVVQSINCLLTREVDEGAEGEFLSLFLKVTRIYETLPGPEIPATHFDKATATDQTTYTQRVAIGTKPNPVSSIKIQGAAIGNPTTTTLDYPHGLPISSTFSVRIAGVKGSTPALDGDYTMTATGANTLTVPVHVTGAATANLGFLSFLKVGQVIIESYVKPDDDAGTVTGTLITICATLPGRESSDPEYDEQRAAHTNEYRQYVVTGTDSRTVGITYKGQTIEDSDCADPFARSHLSEGPAMALLVTKTILLPGDPIVVPYIDEQTGGVSYLIRTRVAIGTSPNTIGGVYKTGPTAEYQSSKIIFENVAVAVRTTIASELGPGRLEAVPGSEPMPRELTFIKGWVYSGDGFQIHGPFAGVNYLMTVHPVATPLIAFVTYTFGRDVTPVVTFGVESFRSRFLPIDSNTIHPAIALTENPPSGGSQPIESLPASISTAGVYVTGVKYNLTVHEHPLEGGENGIWERRIIQFIST